MAMAHGKGPMAMVLNTIGPPQNGDRREGTLGPISKDLDPEVLQTDASFSGVGVSGILVPIRPLKGWFVSM